MKTYFPKQTSTRLLCLILTLALTLPAMITGISADALLGAVTDPISAPASLTGLAPVEHDYVAGGLVAWYSGTQNARSGHSTSSTEWQDLIGSNHITVAKDANNYFTAEGYHLNASQNNFPSAILDVINGSEFTVELHVANLVAPSTMAYNTLMNSGNDNLALFRRHSNDALEFKFAANSGDARHSIPNALASLQDTLITITYRVGGTCSIYYNGVLQQTKSSPSAMGADSLFFGHSEANRQFEALYKNIRFYNRALTEGEVKRNAYVDGFGTYEGMYVQSGLVSMYSGEKNNRTGHDTDATVWQDLIGSNNVTVVKDADNYFTAEGYHLKASQNNFPSTIVDVINGREFTVELYIADLTQVSGMTFNTFLNSTNDNFALFRRTTNDVLEFKFAPHSTGERHSIGNALASLQNTLVTVTYRAGGVCNIYYNGVLQQSKTAPNTTLGVDDFFFGHAQGERQFEALYKGMRFYNRALSDAEVLANAGADEVVSQTVVSPKNVTVAQPATNVVGDVAMVREINTKAELTAVSTATRKPATVIATIDKDLNVKGTNGTTICTVDELLGTLNLTVLTAFRIADTATADALAAYLERINLYDVLLMSEDPAIVKYAREKMPAASGVIDFTKTYGGKTSLTEEDCLAIRRSVKANNAYVAVLPVALCSNDTVQYLFNHQVNVWAKASDTPSTAEQYRAILSGAIGVISDDTASLLTTACALPKNTVTRVPLNIGHRGIPALAPENTVEGALLAHEKGANVIELDIYLTTDNQIVVMHDGDTTRTCNGSMNVEASTLAQLKTLYVNKNHENDQFATCRIPTLAEFLDALRGKDCQLFIEIKSGNTAIVPLMRDLIEERDMYDQCSVITFHAHQLEALRQHYPEMSGGLLCNSNMGGSTVNYESLLRQDMNMIGRYNATLNSGYHAGFLTTNHTRAAFFRGVSIYPWTFRGDINTYKDAFLEGHGGLTGDNADQFGNIIRSIDYISLYDGSNVAIGDVAPLNVIATFFDGRTTATKDGVAVTVLEGANCVTSGANGLTFTENGTVSFVISYTTNIGGNTYVLHSDPITVTVGATASSTIVDWNDRTGGSQVLGVFFDALHSVTNGTQDHSIFTPGQVGAWNKIATLDESVDSLRATGWLSFNTSSYSFGYAIDGGTPVFKAEFTDVTDDAVKNAAAAMGAPACSRFGINVDVSTLSGEHTVDLLIKQANGAVVSFSQFTVVKPTTDSEETTTVTDTTVTEPAVTEPAPTVTEPVYNVSLDHLYEMGVADHPIHSQSCTAAWGANNEYLTFTVTGGDPYVAAIALESSATVTNRMYILYRTTVADASPEFFVGSTGGWDGHGDYKAGETYVSDGEWHVMVLDLSTVERFDGTTARYLRFDLFSKDEVAPAGSTIDVKMVAFFNSDADAEAYVSANYGLSLKEEEDTTEQAPETTTEPEDTTTKEPEVTTPEPEDSTTKEPEVTTEPEHVCSFGAWSEARPATCTAGGVSMRRCACGNSETKAIPATGHTAGGWIVDSAAQPGVNGSKHIECTACHITLKTEIIPALPVEIEPGHTCSFGDWNDTIPATCTAGGLSTRTCACGNFESKSIPAPGHNESNWIVDSEAQPGENGSKHVECTVCHVTLRSEIILALPVLTEPDVTTAEPKDTTAEPDVTTDEPEDTTIEPEDTTNEPEDTTIEPEDTTIEPEDTTIEPEVTTNEPEDTTNEPEVTTAELTTDTQPEDDDGLPVGAVVAIVIGSIVVAGGIGFAVYRFVIKKKKND